MDPLIDKTLRLLFNTKLGHIDRCCIDDDDPIKMTFTSNKMLADFTNGQTVDKYMKVLNVGHSSPHPPYPPIYDGHIKDGTGQKTKAKTATVLSVNSTAWGIIDDEKWDAKQFSLGSMHES